MKRMKLIICVLREIRWQGKKSSNEETKMRVIRVIRWSTNETNERNNSCNSCNLLTIK